MAKIICDAIPFCYGPISKLLTVAELLRDGNDLTILADGTSMDMAMRTSFRVMRCDTENPDDLKKVENGITNSDMYINVMNPVSAEIFAGKVPHAYIDSLFWMWDTIPKCLYDVEFYFIQNFFGVECQLGKFGDRIKNKHVVGPIVDERFKGKSRKRNQLLVNFGGMESRLVKVGENTNYPFFMTDIIRDALDGTEYDRILITGSGGPISKLSAGKSIPKAEFRTLGHDDFLKELDASRTVLTSPGLTTSFEAFAYGIPAYFLPPQNYSQFLNLKKFREAGIGEKSLHWIDLYPEMDIAENEEESKGVEKTLKAVARFEGDYTARRAAIEAMRRMFDDKDAKLGYRQSEFFRSLGGNGATEIASKIREYLNR